MTETEYLERQLAAARMGWDAAKRAASHYEKKFRELKRTADPSESELEGQREANARLTAEVERLETILGMGGLQGDAPPEMLVAGDAHHGCDAWLHLSRVGMDDLERRDEWPEHVTEPVRYVRADVAEAEVERLREERDAWRANALRHQDIASAAVTRNEVLEAKAKRSHHIAARQIRKIGEACGTEFHPPERVEDAEVVASAVAYLKTEVERLRIALRDAINQPKGVVPDSATEFWPAVRDLPDAKTCT